MFHAHCRARCVSSAAIVLISIASIALAAPVLADTLALQGALGNAAGGPVADGTYAMAVTLYADADGADKLHQELFIEVAVAGGMFAIALGENDNLPLDAIALAGQAAWIGVKVAGEPELPLVALVPVLRAWRADLADNAIAANTAVEADHAKAADTAKTALAADTAKEAAHAAVADTAKSADNATESAHSKTSDNASNALTADVAKNADFATSADEATLASKALSLQCTGCVEAAMLADDVLAPYAKTADLGAVATLDGDNIFTGKNSFVGLSAGKGQVVGMRMENSDGPPIACDASLIGYIYYDTGAQALRLCNGNKFVDVAFVGELGSEGHPAKSCKALAGTDDDSGDGLYWVDGDGDGPIAKQQVTCDMTTSGGGWMRVADVDAAKGCPGQWQQVTSGALKACWRNTGGAVCRTASFATVGAAWSEARGYVKAFQYASMDGFHPSVGIDGTYVDGISLTHGTPRKHIWSWGVGLQKSGAGGNGCPCAPGGSAVPGFVGNNWYCESTNPTGTWSAQWYTADVLYDGKGCPAGNTCCAPSGLPWFQRDMGSSGSDALDARLCSDQESGNEDIGVTRMELWVR